MPHIFICNIHPFDPSITTGIAHDEGCLGSEGIAPLNEEEKLQFAGARERAQLVGSKEFGTSPFAAETEVAQGKLVRWIFSAFKKDGTTEVVKINA